MKRRLALAFAPLAMIAGLLLPATTHSTCANRTIHYEDGSTLTLDCHGNRVSTTSVPW